MGRAGKYQFHPSPEAHTHPGNWYPPKRRNSSFAKVPSGGRGGHAAGCHLGEGERFRFHFPNVQRSRTARQNRNLKGRISLCHAVLCSCFNEDASGPRIGGPRIGRRKVDAAIARKFFPTQQETFVSLRKQVPLLGEDTGTRGFGPIVDPACPLPIGGWLKPGLMETSTRS